MTDQFTELSPGQKRVWDEVPCSLLESDFPPLFDHLRCPTCGFGPCLGPHGCPRATHITPQPEGTPAMQADMIQRAEEPKDQRALPGRLAHAEDLITAIDNDVQALHALADRLMGATPEDPQREAGQDHPDAFIHQFEQQIDRLERLRNSVRTLNERLSEAV